MSEARAFSSKGLLEALDAGPLPEHVVTLMSVNGLDFEQGLIDAIRATWQEAPEQAMLPQLFPKYDDFENERFGMPHYMSGKAMMCTWWMLCEWLPEFTPEDQRIDGVEEFADHLVVYGDLTIEGDFGLDSFVYYDKSTGTDWTPHLVVLGDLIVEGNFTHDGGLFFVGGDMHVNGRFYENSDWSLLAIRGDMRVREHVDSRGELFVGGCLMAPMIELTYNHAYSTILGDIVAVLLVVRDHGDSWCGGKIQAPLTDLELMMGEEGEWAEVPYPSLDALRDALAPKVFVDMLEGSYEEDGMIFDADGAEVFIQEFAYSLREEHAPQGVVRPLFSPAALAVFDNLFNG